MAAELNTSQPELLLEQFIDDGIDEDTRRHEKILFDDLLYVWIRYAVRSSLLDASDYRIFVKAAYLCLVQNARGDGNSLYFTIQSLKITVGTDLPEMLSEESYKEVVKAVLAQQRSASGELL